MKTILVVAHAWNEDVFGGAFRLATELAIRMAAEGCHVTYLCCNCANAPDRETINGVEVRRYRVHRKGLFAVPLWQHVYGAQRLTRQIKADFEVIAVSAHSPLQYLGVLLELGVNPGIHRTYVVHSPFADEQLASVGISPLNWKSRFKALVASLIDRWCLRRTDVAICLSKFTAMTLQRRYGSWIESMCQEVPGWVDTNRFRPSANLQTLRDHLPAEWQTNDPILFTVRRLEKRMGLDTLIDAAAQLAESHRFRILIGGTGAEASNLTKRIKVNGLQDRVFLLGRIPEQILDQCYAGADLFVLPTRSLECFGLIVLEAFASGIPVIGSRVGAIPELLDQFGDEWMFEPGDAKSLASCLRKFLNGELNSSLNPREIAMNYDISRLLPRWIELNTGSIALAMK